MEDAKPVDVPVEGTEHRSTWDERLREPFPAGVICYKPKLWCGKCRQAPARVCGEHRRAKCPDCKQNMSEAHFHVDYVGHADTTDRLLQVDPAWSWKPLYKDVNPEVLKAAIATGSAEIVAMVMAAAPPHVDADGGMWIELAIHDDCGEVVTRMGYGDAEGKSGPNATKERIGDAIRNGAMRFGVALDLWSKSDIREAKAGDADAGTLRKPRGASSRPAAAEDLSAVDPKAQALADLAWKYAQDHRTAAELHDDVYEAARKDRILRSKVADPASPPDSPGLTALSNVIQAAKQVMVAFNAEASSDEG